jgi:carboxypeptidase C (cathepsin A)
MRYKFLLLAGLAAAAHFSAAPCAAIAAPAPAAVPEPAFTQSFVTHHAGVFGGKKVDYTATVSNTVLTDDAGQPAVNFVSTAYVRDGVADASKRPVIFLFSGGPSNASIAYHMRFMGPKQVIDPAPGSDGKSVLRDNPDALLDIVDLVFVDTAETGFTRILPAGKRPYFYSVNGDTASIEQFMDRWLKAHGREASPRYVMGGSYGSVRAIRIGWDSLKSRPVDGVIMTANSLMLQEEVGVIGDVLPLATYATTAVYHGKADRRGRTDEEIVEETYKFAIDEYLPALSRVQDLTPQARADMAEKLHRITGLPAADILAKDLVISRDDFENGLLKDEGKRLSNHYDGRVTAPASAPDAPAHDTAYDMLQAYMAHDLGVTYPMSDYRPSAPDTDSWEFKGPNGASRNDWPGMTREYLEANPKGWVYSANGLYDLQGVMGQAHWLVSRTRMPRDRFFLRQYAGGHALYSDPATASILLKELRKIIEDRT